MSFMTEGQTYIRFAGKVKTKVKVTKVYPNEIRYTMEGVEGELACQKSVALGNFYLLVAREVTSDWTATHHQFTEEGWNIAYNLVQKPVKKKEESFKTINGRIEDGMVCPY